MMTKPEDTTLFGMKVVIVPLLDKMPKMQLSQALVDIIQPYKPEFVKETNKWLLDFFGGQNNIVINEEKMVMYMGPKGWASVKAKVDDLNYQTTALNR